MLGSTHINGGFPRWLSIANAGDEGSILGSGRNPIEGNGSQFP